MAEVHGQYDPAFRGVREVFEQSFADGREIGGAVAIYQGDRLVADLWGGVADRKTGRRWERDTPCLAFSCTKAVTAAAAALLAERGAYDVEGPVASWWPEFAEGGKEAVTAAHLLSHQAGLPALARPVSAEEAADPAAVAAQLASQTPEWEPGTAHGYHGLTYGWLAGEIVRRHAGTTVGEFARQEFAGDLDLWIGSPDDVIARSARLGRVKGAAPDGAISAAGTEAAESAGAAARAVAGSGSDLLDRMAKAYLDPESLINRALNNPGTGPGGYNNPVVVRGGWPAAGMQTTARALATFYKRLISGKIVSRETLDRSIERRVDGPDRTLLVDSSFGLGFMRPSLTFLTPKPGRDTAFGHTGAGGSIGLGDPEHGLTLAYIPNGMGNELSGDLRAYRLLEAAYAAL